jgi:TatD DNase family protein
MFVDTHTHLYSKEFDTDRDILIQKAQANGVQKFYLPNIDSESIEDMLNLESNYPNVCFSMMGLHPCSVNANFSHELSIVKNWLKKRSFVGIGEIGIDLYWDKTFFEEQKMAFETQINWALDYNYPIVIHCREAFEPIYQILKRFKTLPKGIFHCFSGSLEQAHQILELGDFKLGIGGVVTFKNAGLDKVIEHIDLKHLVLETDAPYLAPIPFRGKRNEPVYLLEIAKKIADIKKVTIHSVESITQTNSNFIFNSRDR